MTTEEILLTILTVVIVILVAIAISVLVVILAIARKINHVTDQVQIVADKGTKVAEVFTPLGVAGLGVFQAMRVIMKRR